jgi:1-acyl-sn-glycerol-3-phosphate acyltransferase
LRRTFFNTPVIRHLAFALSWLGLKAAGWRIEGPAPAKKCVLIAAPHTSNWDFPLMLAAAFVFRLEVFWMGKDALFRRPIAAGLMKWLGGIPIDRSRTNNVVDQMVDIFDRSDGLIVVIPPEGTRSKVTRWKTGFYYIALGAKVPIATGFLDFKRKVAGFGPQFDVTGDIENDLRDMQEFYSTVTAKFPDKSGLDAERRTDLP